MLPFAGGVGLAMLLTAVPLFLAPLRVGLANNLFPQHYITITYFVSYALVMGVHLVAGMRFKHVPNVLRFDLGQALVGTLGCALLVAGRIVLNAIHDSWLAAGQPTDFPVVPAWVDPMRCAGAALSALAASCALLSAYRLLRRLDARRAIIACAAAFCVLATLTVGLTYATGFISLGVYAIAPALAWALLRKADVSVPYADLAEPAMAGVHIDSEGQTGSDVGRRCALFGALFLLGLWTLEFAGSHKAGDNGYLMVPAFAPLALGAFAVSCRLMLSPRRAPEYGLLCRAAFPTLGMCTLLIYLPEGAGPTLYLETLAAALALAALLLVDMTAWCANLTRAHEVGLGSERLFILQRITLCGALLATDITYGLNLNLYMKLKIAIALLVVALAVVTFCYARPGRSAGRPAANGPGLLDGERSSDSVPAGEDSQQEKRPWRAEIEGHGLTARESEVFVLLMEDLDAQAIAVRLGISRTTVNTHIQHVYTKFGVHSYKELSRAMRK